MSPDGKSAPSQWSVNELGAFYVENRHEFLAHARRTTGSKSEAEEVVQDALIRVLLACPELESVTHARSYFHRVIENLSVDLHRREGRRPRLVVLDDVTSEIEARWNSTSDLAEAMSGADDAAIVRDAISLLSPAERTALIMWEIEGRTTSEIAVQLGIKENAVRHTLSRARAGLRRILSERIIDPERGLTALDLLSTTYRRANDISKNSARVALSLILFLVAFLSVNSTSFNDLNLGRVTESFTDQLATDEADNSKGLESGSRGDRSPIENSDADQVLNNDLTRSEVAGFPSFDFRSSDLGFAGLDEAGVPTGFIVADSLGQSGALFCGKQTSILTESGHLLSNIVSTKSGATNVLLNQSVIVDPFGTEYVAEVSVGIGSGWSLLRLAYVASEIERLASGNYLLIATMVVDSAVETAVKVSTGSSGANLRLVPSSIYTRLVLDPTKTTILAQAVLVSADSQEGEA